MAGVAIRACYSNDCRHCDGASHNVRFIFGADIGNEGKASMSYQVIIEKADGALIAFPAYDNWTLASATASELASIVDASCVVRFVANEQAVRAGAGADYAEYLKACEKIARGEVSA